VIKESNNKGRAKWPCLLQWVVGRCVFFNRRNGNPWL